MLMCIDMETLIALRTLCEGNPPANFPHNGPVMVSFGVSFLLASCRTKSTRYWWYETPWRPSDVTGVNVITSEMFTFLICCCRPSTPYVRMTNHSFRDRKPWPSGIPQCYKQSTMGYVTPWGVSELLSLCHILKSSHWNEFADQAPVDDMNTWQGTRTVVRVIATRATYFIRQTTKPTVRTGMRTYRQISDMKNLSWL